MEDVAAGLVLQRAGSGRDSIVFTSGFTPDPELGRINPWQPVFDEAPIGRVRVFERPTEVEVKDSPYFRQVLAPQGLAWGPHLGLVLARDELGSSCHLALMPLEHRRRLDAADVKLLQELSSHLVRARRIHVALALKTATAEGVLAATDRLLVGILLLDETGRLVFANRSACDLVGIEDGHDISDADRHRARRWATGSARRSLDAVGPRSAEAVTARHPEDGRPLQVLMAPLAPGSDPIIPGVEITTAVFVGDPKRNPGQPYELLHELYGLSPGEAKLALALASDLSLEEAAAQLEIKVSTARTRLKHVFAKTGTKRQASLVRLLHAAPALLRAEDVDEPPAPDE